MTPRSCGSSVIPGTELTPGGGGGVVITSQFWIGTVVTARVCVVYQIIKWTRYRCCKMVDLCWDTSVVCLLSVGLSVFLCPCLNSSYKPCKTIFFVTLVYRTSNSSNLSLIWSIILIYSLSYFYVHWTGSWYSSDLLLDLHVVRNVCLSSRRIS